MFGVRTGLAVTENHELHRIRRAPFAQYFSQSSIQKLELRIQSVVDKLSSRLQGLKGSGTPVDLKNLFACMTADVIGQYAFNQSYGFLDSLDFSPWWHDILMEVSQNGHTFKQFGIMLPMIKALPLWMLKLANPQMLALVQFQQRFRNQVLEAKGNIAGGEKHPDQTTNNYDILLNDNVRAQEKLTNHLTDETQTIVGAGTATTAHILAIASFRIIDGPPILQKLQAELTVVMSDAHIPKWQQLEQIP